MTAVLALVRAQWETRKSYRAGLLFSVLSVGISILPVYFIADAIQPVVADSIAEEGGEYFGFLVVGIASTYIMWAAVNVLPNMVGEGIRNGTLEALFSTPARVPAILLGLAGFDLLWAWGQAILLTAAFLLLGGELRPAGILIVLLAGILTCAAYFGVALAGAGAILLFRTTGPFLQGVIVASSLLGGVYYSVSVIPELLQPFARIVPLAHGLRMARIGLFEGGTFPLREMASLTLLALLLLLGGVLVFSAALRAARRNGALGQY